MRGGGDGGGPRGQRRGADGLGGAGSGRAGVTLGREAWARVAGRREERAGHTHLRPRLTALRER